MFNSNKLFKCLTLTFLFVIINTNIFASKSLEKKIKKLEAQVIEYEKKHLKTQNSKGYARKNSVAKITGLSKNDKRRKVIEKSKEINVELPEYDPETKTISVKNTSNVRIDAKAIGSVYSKKVYFNLSNEKSKKENYVGNDEITIENGNLILTEKFNNKQDISDLEVKLALVLSEELAAEKSKLNKNKNHSSTIVNKSGKRATTNKTNVLNKEKNSKKFDEKDVNVIVEGFDFINKVDSPI
ncbi:hypothetical protein [Fusobacterium sp. PH5-44]|uniref:hypothetical protein n=1 Tax=unclassified Fusobacterium TaxID=2648384 RepID=UPI003D1EE7B4